MASEIQKVIIIGSGCAGLTAALYTARAQLAPVVLTGAMPGGLLTTTSTVENFPGFPEGVDGTDLMIRMQQQAEHFGAKVNFGATVEKVNLDARPFTLTVDGDEMSTQTIIIASGAGHRHLGLESEKQLDKKGVTYCATCDGALPIFRDQPLIVVGGGDSACEEAAFLTRFASRVYLVHRRNELRASKIMADRVLSNEMIEPIWDSEISEILGVEQGGVTGVRLRNNRTGQEQKVECAGVFIAVGHVPNTQIFQGKIEMDHSGYITRIKGAQTSVQGVFVAGDCSDKMYRQAITAAGMGCAAAIEAERFLACENE
jgi:thioredoxin reductase (NADPH)